MPPQHIFTKAGLSSFLSGLRTRAETAAASVSISELQAEGLAGLLERFYTAHELAPIILTEPAISVAMEDVQVDVSQDPNRFIRDRRNPFYLPGTRTIYYIPFSGNPTLLDYTPGTFTQSPPFLEAHSKELRFIYDIAGNDLGSIKPRYEHDFSELKRWVSWSWNDVAAFNRELRDTLGAALERRQALLAQREQSLADLGVPVRRQQSTLASAVVGAPPQPAAVRRYDVALSFAGEQRTYVEQVALALRAAGYAVFYDEFESASLWGKNLVDHLADVYQKLSDYVIMFASAAYASKAWPTHERQHAQARALVTKGDYILPVRFDDTDIPGLAPTVKYVDARIATPADLADLACTKIGPARYGV